MRHLMICVVALFGLMSFADETAPTKKEEKPDKSKWIEMHKKAAEMHTKMAECLATDSTPEKCREEHMKNCPGKEGGGDCPMHHGHGMHGKGMMKGKMKKD